MTRPTMNQERKSNAVCAKGISDVADVANATSAARCSTPGCLHHAQENHRHCKNCYATWKAKQDAKRAAAITQNIADSSAAPSGICSNPKCQESTFNGHKFCSTCYVAWRKTRGHCKWRMSNGQLCGIPVAGGNPFCHECYTKRYLPCVSSAPKAALTDVHKAGALHADTEPRKMPLVDISDNHIAPYDKTVASSMSQGKGNPLPMLAKTTMCARKANVKTMVSAVTSMTSQPSQASLHPTLFANAPSFTPVSMASVRKTGRTAPVVDQENFRAVKAAAPRVALSLSGLISPGTKAAQYVTHTWERVNANAAKSVIQMQRAVPEEEAAPAPTWRFSVFPGDLGNTEALPDPSNDKLMRLVRNSWRKKRPPTLVGACA